MLRAMNFLQILLGAEMMVSLHGLLGFNKNNIGFVKVGRRLETTKYSDYL